MKTHSYLKLPRPEDSKGTFLVIITATGYHMSNHSKV